MDEVKAMAKAGETVGKAVGTGIKQARHGAKRAGETGAVLSKQAAARAEQELANHGISTDELAERIAQRATGKTRKQLAKDAKQARKQWDKKAKRSRKQLAARIDPKPAKRRRWPWAVLLLMALGAVAAVVLTRRPEELPLASADHDAPKPDAPAPPVQPRHRATPETESRIATDARTVETPRTQPPAH